MVMNLSTKQGRVLKFHSDALDPNVLLVASLTITDGISSLWSAHLDCVSHETDIDSAKVLQNPAWLGIKQGLELSGGGAGVQTLRYHGMVDSFEVTEKGKDWTAYRVVLAPKLARLALTVQTAIYMEKSVPQIVEEVLKKHGFTSSDYEMKASRSALEYVCQYQESDLDFISRWLEWEGISYFCQSTEEGEKVVFSDSTGDYAPILGGSKLRYQPARANLAANWFGAETISRFACQHRITPAKVVLNDYNYRTPSTPLKAEADASADGVGTMYSFGGHFKDCSAGKKLAAVRAEELTCREKIYLGASDARSMRSGATFSLSNHFRDDFNTDYVCIESKHWAEQTLAFGQPGSPQASYRNEFTCIPASVLFRPKRVTPVPRIAGTINATVDAAGDGTYAEIDDQGRYKVTMPFDLSGKSGGKASRYLRMAQPYAGAGMGMHFPLHKGTEVVLAFTNASPDRPFILAAIPNPETAGPVSAANQTQNRIQSGGGNNMTMEDQDGRQRITFYSPHGKTYFSFGASSK